MTNLEKYNNVFARVLGARPEELNETYTFQSVEKWDSVAHLSLITELEDAFDIMFDSEDILHYGSYFNGIEILKRYGVEF
jgi:acyl carrier protein